MYLRRFIVCFSGWCWRFGSVSGFFPDVVGAFVPAVSASLVNAVFAYSPVEQPNAGQKKFPNTVLWEMCFYALMRAYGDLCVFRISCTEANLKVTSECASNDEEAPAWVGLCASALSRARLKRAPQPVKYILLVFSYILLFITNVTYQHNEHEEPVCPS